MISAMEARSIVEEIQARALTEELKRVENLINEAVQKGEFKVYVGGVLKEETKNVLKNLGYSIEVGGRYNEIDTVIEW